MKALSGSKHAQEIEELTKKLIKIDPMRKEYYKDLRMYFDVYGDTVRELSISQIFSLLWLINAH